MVRWRASFFATAMSAGYAGVAAVIWLGGRALIHGELTPGDLTSFFLYTFIVAGALADLASAVGRAAARGRRDRSPVRGHRHGPRHPRSRARRRRCPPGSGAIRLEGVSFAYPTRRGQPVLTDVDLEIAPGEVVALVGPSGAGKSTILSLLYRFYDVDAGRVLFEGVDVRELKLAELRRSLAMVAQEPVLLAGTIRDNIAYGRDGATDAEIEAAARDAYAHDFIIGVPRRLRHADRRARHEAVGRPEAAHRARPRAGREPARADPRRGDLEPRRRERGRGPGRARARHAGRARRSSSRTA